MLSVVVATDDLRIWETFAAEIEGAGCQAHWAADGLEALQRVASQSAHLIFLDLGITVVSAWDCCETLRGDPEVAADLAIYILTDDEVNPHTRDHKGATGIMAKTPAAGEIGDILPNPAPRTNP